MEFTTHDELAGWLDTLAQETSLIAPQEIGGVLLYSTVKSSKHIVWDFTRPVLSIKDVVFPATERLMNIEKIGGQIELVETLPEGQQVAFGVRPCDARGLKMLDALFLNTEPRDPYYARRRENTTLIGLACRQMGPTCFCTSPGGAPDDPSDVDVMLYPVEDGYFVQPVTEKGQRLLRSSRLETIERVPEPGQAGNSPRWSQAEKIPVPAESAWPAHFESEYWDQVAERCLSCRICAYVCPTCRCFDLRDEALPSNNGGSAYERIRCWDSCAGEAYRRIAGGHNPRSQKGQRLRNRFLCKFDYFPRQYSLGTSACTGCGRCIDACPVNIDITEVMGHLVEVSGC